MNHQLCCIFQLFFQFEGKFEKGNWKTPTRWKSGEAVAAARDAIPEGKAAAAQMWTDRIGGEPISAGAIIKSIQSRISAWKTVGDRYLKKQMKGLKKNKTKNNDSILEGGFF